MKDRITATAWFEGSLGKIWSTSRQVSFIFKLSGIVFREVAYQLTAPSMVSLFGSFLSCLTFSIVKYSRSEARTFQSCSIVGGENASIVLKDLTSTFSFSFFELSFCFGALKLFERITGVRLSKQGSVKEDIGPGSSSPSAFLYISLSFIAAIWASSSSIRFSRSSSLCQSCLLATVAFYISS